MSMISEKRVAVLIDAENVALQPVRSLFEQVAPLGRIIARKAYADWSAGAAGAAQKAQLLDLGIEPVHHLRALRGGKNASDILLTIDAMDLLYGGSVEVFVIVSADSDFVPLVRRLRTAGKEVYGAGPKKSASQTLVQACDGYFDLDAPAPKARAQPQPTRKKAKAVQAKNTVYNMDPSGTLLAAFSSVEGKSRSVKGSTLHEALLGLDPTFDYKALGFGTFKRFVDASGVLRITSSKDGEDSVQRVSAAAPAVETPAPAPEDWGAQIHEIWAKRAPEKGAAIASSTAAEDAAKVLRAPKLSASPFKTLQRLLAASPVLTKNWKKDRNNVARK
jgi:uncharacterized LabA/DUF88 family protein